MSPLVSVVIPVRNGERFLRRTLVSALAQTHNPIEFVVVDDGSTDGSSDILADAAAADGRIRLFRSQGNGPAAARNFGISRARGTLIAPLDHDDLWHPEKVDRQVRVMQESPPTVGLVYCWSVHIDEDDCVIGSAMSHTARGRVTAELAGGNFIVTSSAPLIKRACIDAVGGYDAELRPHGADDWKLYLALSEICDFAVVPEYLVGYRRWLGNMSRDIDGMARSTELVAAWLHQKWPDIPNEVERQRVYKLNVHLAEAALDADQLFAACRYRTRAYRARPAALFERSGVEFGARILVRMVGVKRGALSRLLTTPQARAPFHEWCQKQV
jgi:glycosyltransferase involved in cell wall biosynthesis